MSNKSGKRIMSAKRARNCHSMQVALKLLGFVADAGFDKNKPDDREKRSSLIRGLFMTKYERAKLNTQKEAENVETETKPVPVD